MRLEQVASPTTTNIFVGSVMYIVCILYTVCYISIYLRYTEILRCIQKFQITHTAFKILQSEKAPFVLGRVLIQSHRGKDMMEQMKAT